MKMLAREYIEELAKKQVERERLRSAAPDLLAALERALPILREHVYGRHEDMGAHEAARAAIAKATGK